MCIKYLDGLVLQTIQSEYKHLLSLGINLLLYRSCKRCDESSNFKTTLLRTDFVSTTVLFSRNSNTNCFMLKPKWTMQVSTCTVLSWRKPQAVCVCSCYQWLRRVYICFNGCWGRPGEHFHSARSRPLPRLWEVVQSECLMAWPQPLISGSSASLSGRECEATKIKTFATVCYSKYKVKRSKGKDIEDMYYIKILAF